MAIYIVGIIWRFTLLQVKSISSERDLVRVFSIDLKWGTKF